MAENKYRREGFIISVEEHTARGGAPGLRFRFGDLRDGRIIPFQLSNGVLVNPAPALTLFRAQQGDTKKNDEINEETLMRLGYVGDHDAIPTVAQFTSGASRSDAKPVEIVWQVTQYGNEVLSVREVVTGRRNASGKSSFFHNLKGPQDKESFDDEQGTNGNGEEGDGVH